MEEGGRGVVLHWRLRGLGFGVFRTGLVANIGAPSSTEQRGPVSTIQYLCNSCMVCPNFEVPLGLWGLGNPMLQHDTALSLGHLERCISSVEGFCPCLEGETLNHEAETHKP